jgi:hypothetical protein
MGRSHDDMTADDREYYLKRVEQEEQAARDAVSIAARWRHEELAGLYRIRILAFDNAGDEGCAPGSFQPFILGSTPGETEAA